MLKEIALPQAYRQEIAYRQTRWPAHKDLATGGPDEVGNRKTLVPRRRQMGRAL
jgi:hypothetical protein